VSRPVLSCRIGVAGSGKTLSCVIWTCTEFLPYETGKLITNLPFLVEKIADAYAGSKGVNGPMTRDEVLGRFQIIPREVLDGWADEQGGPWDYFEGQSIAGAHIMLDEAHNFVGAKHTAKWRKRWQQWIGELRHQGATLELVTQAENKLAKEFKEEAERHVMVINSETRRDPVFGILGGDFSQLMAKLIPGYGYRCSTIVEEKRNNGGRKFVVENVTKFGRDPGWFDLYESHNAPTTGGTAGRRQLQYEVLSTWAFTQWFLVRNAKGILTANITKMAVLAAIFLIPQSRNYLASLVKSGLDAQRKNAVAGEAGKGTAKSGMAQIPPEPTLAPGGDLVLDANRATQAIGQARNVVARSDALTPDKRDEVIAQLTAAQERYAEAFALNMEFVGVVGDDLLMRNGERYGINEPIRDGPLMGRSVQAVDRRRRELLLDDGRRLKLGGVPKPVPQSGNAVPGAAGVPGSGQPSPGTGFPQAVRRNPVGQAGQVGSQSPAAGVRGSVRGGAADSPGMGGGAVDGIRRGGPLDPPYARGAAPAGSDGR